VSLSNNLSQNKDCSENCSRELKRININLRLLLVKCSQIWVKERNEHTQGRDGMPTRPRKDRWKTLLTREVKVDWDRAAAA
jgi:hypothetical protein